MSADITTEEYMKVYTAVERALYPDVRPARMADAAVVRVTRELVNVLVRGRSVPRNVTEA
jgi:hypothetical protein